jgi:hypothetical protein
MTSEPADATSEFMGEDGAVRLFRRRPAKDPKAAALAEARRATARLRRRSAETERYRAGKQADPVTRMTTNQWIGGGS